MFKNVFYLIVLGAVLFSATGCALMGAAISAGVGYGIYQATHK
jgi:hypothetical protein